MPPKACMQYQSYILDPLSRSMVWKTSHSLQYVLQVVAYTPTFKRSQREIELKLSHVTILLFLLFSSIKWSTLQMECSMWTHHLLHNTFPSFGCILNPWHYPNTKFSLHVNRVLLSCINEYLASYFSPSFHQCTNHVLHSNIVHISHCEFGITTKRLGSLLLIIIDLLLTKCT
jgi:hypothetical protein